MKSLVLKDKTKLECSEISNPTRLVIKVDSFDAVDTIATTITNENLDEFTLDGKTYFKAKVNNITATQKDGVTNVIVDCAYDTIQEALDAYTFELIQGGIL